MLAQTVDPRGTVGGIGLPASLGGQVVRRCAVGGRTLSLPIANASISTRHQLVRQRDDKQVE